MTSFEMQISASHFCEKQGFKDKYEQNLYKWHKVTNIHN